MDKKTLVAIITWIVLAVLNIVSVFVTCGFLIWTNAIFACYNVLVIAAFAMELFSKKKEE